MKKLSGLFFSIFVLAIGILLLFLFGSEAKRCSEPVEGTVVGYAVEQDSEGSTFYHPQIQYVFEKKHYTEQSSVGYGKKEYAEGEELVIMVNPDNPYEFIIKGENTFKIVGIICVILGIILIFGDILNLLGFGGKTYYIGNGQASGVIMDVIAFFFAIIKGRPMGEAKGYDDSAAANGWDDEGVNAEAYEAPFDESEERNYDDYN